MDAADDEAITWRTHAKERLGERFILLDPMRRSFRDHEIDMGSPREMYRRSPVARDTGTSRSTTNRRRPCIATISARRVSVRIARTRRRRC